LTIAKLDVLESVPLLGQGEQVLGEEGDLLDVNGEFVGAGAEQISANADVVAEIEQLEKLESLVAHGILLYVNLKLLAHLLHMHEAGLAHKAHGHDASCDAYVHARGLELLIGRIGVLRQDLGNGVGELESVRIGLVAKGFNLL
jgi:hypothetical protein